MTKHKNPLLYKPDKQGAGFLDEILKIVIDDFPGMTEKQLQTKTRNPDIVLARQFAHRLARHFTNCSLSEIGNRIGQKDHSTVLHSSKTIDNLADAYPSVKERYNKLFNRITNVALLKSRGVQVCSQCGSSDLYANVTISVITMRIVTEVNYNNVFCKSCMEQVRAMPEIDYKIKNGLL